MQTAYLSLGSNLGNREANLRDAIKALGQIGNMLKCSSFIETEPWHFKSPHSFLNVAVCIETELAPLPLLEATQEIEHNMGRQRKTQDGQYQDRLIDIDILFYGGQVIEHPRLQIPHPLLHQRLFVLQPLSEIAPSFVHPLLNKTVLELEQSLHT